MEKSETVEKLKKELRETELINKVKEEDKKARERTT